MFFETSSAEFLLVRVRRGLQCHVLLSSAVIVHLIICLELRAKPQLTHGRAPHLANLGKSAPPTNARDARNQHADCPTSFTRTRHPPGCASPPSLLLMALVRRAESLGLPVPPSPAETAYVVMVVNAMRDGELEHSCKWTVETSGLVVLVQSRTHGIYTTLHFGNSYNMILDRPNLTYTHTCLPSGASGPRVTDLTAARVPPSCNRL